MALELISDQGFRLDGRKPNELRKIQCRLGVFGQADGSAYLEQGNTKVLATVYGPHEVRGSRSKIITDRALVNCEYSMAPFSTSERKSRPKGDRKSQEMSMHLKRTFEATILVERYPRSQIDIYLEVLQSDGGNFCVCVNATTLALIDAGVAVKDYVCSCSVSSIVDRRAVDINYVEESSVHPNMTVALLPKSGQIVLMEMSSRLHIDQLDGMIDASTKACRDVHRVLDQTVRHHLAEGAQLLVQTLS